MTTQKAIFGLFTKHSKLRFSEIQQHTGIRSNTLAYLLKRLQVRGVLEKEGEQYVLSAASQKRLPYFHPTDALSPLPVLLIRCQQNGKTLFIKREKRPYEHLWGLPGGRVYLGETIEQAAKRILKEKTFIECELAGVHAFCNERLLAETETKHGFFLLVVNVTPTSSIKEKPAVRWFSEPPEALTIPSDYFLSSCEPGSYECVLLPRTGEPTTYDSVIHPIRTNSLLNQ
jgi:ADP-ribose pyrophosphatase YjhB (NUDIX family)